MTTPLDAVEARLQVAPEHLTWDTCRPDFEALLAQDLTAADVPAWLDRWSALQAQMGDVSARLSIHKDLHTDDDTVQQRYQDYVAQVLPPATRMEQALTEKLLAVPGYAPAPDFALNHRRFRDAAALFREANVDLSVTENEQSSRHSVITGNQKVTLDGQDLTIPQVKQRLDSPDRAQREAAWRAWQDSNMAVAGELDAVMLDLIGTRRQMAKNADEPGEAQSNEATCPQPHSQHEAEAELPPVLLPRSMLLRKRQVFLKVSHDALGVLMKKIPMPGGTPYPLCQAGGGAWEPACSPAPPAGWRAPR